MNNAKELEDGVAPEKKPRGGSRYNPPQLIKYGNISKLTEGMTGSKSGDGLVMTML